MHFSGSPVFWMDEFQVKADFISARLKDEELYKVHLQDAAVMGRRLDDSHFEGFSDAGKDIALLE